MVFENKEEETDVKSSNKGKDDQSHSHQIKLNNFTVSLWRHKQGRSVQHVVTCWILCKLCVVLSFDAFTVCRLLLISPL